jgi:alkylhydroperoxidase/carboxymuconolactone decarboxylase family protein YurZ
MRRIYILVGLVFVLSSFSNILIAQNHMNNNVTLSPGEQRIIAIAALTAKGDLSNLKTELNAGLEAGLSINQIKEVLVHLYAYCGFPRSIRGLQTFMEVLNNRKAKGIDDVLGAEASPIQEERSKYERGKEILGKLTGLPQDEPKTGYSAFAPEIDIFLKEHLFADIFERDVLSYSARELVTISVISSIGGAEPMLRAHLNICLNVGYTPNQLRQFVKVIETIVGEEEVKKVQSVLDEVLRSKNST